MFQESVFAHSEPNGSLLEKEPDRKESYVFSESPLKCRSRVMSEQSHGSSLDAHFSLSCQFIPSLKHSKCHSKIEQICSKLTSKETAYSSRLRSTSSCDELEDIILIASGDLMVDELKADKRTKSIVLNEDWKLCFVTENVCLTFRSEKLRTDHFLTDRLRRSFMVHALLSAESHPEVNKLHPKLQEQAFYGLGMIVLREEPSKRKFILSVWNRLHVHFDMELLLVDFIVKTLGEVVSRLGLKLPILFFGSSPNHSAIEAAELEVALMEPRNLGHVDHRPIGTAFWFLLTFKKDSLQKNNFYLMQNANNHAFMEVNLNDEQLTNARGSDRLEIFGLDTLFAFKVAINDA